MSVKILVFTSPTCPYCPSAVKAVKAIKDEVKDLTIEEVSTASPNGNRLAKKHGIMSVPTTIVIGKASENIGFRGAPSRQSLLKAINIAKGIEKFEEKVGFLENLKYIIHKRFKVKIRI